VQLLSFSYKEIRKMESPEMMVMAMPPPATAASSNKKTITSESAKVLGNALQFLERVKEKRENGGGGVQVNSSMSSNASLPVKFNTLKAEDLKLTEVRKCRGQVLNKIFKALAHKEEAWANRNVRPLTVLLLNYLEAASFLRSNWLWVKEVRRQNEAEYARAFAYNPKAKRAWMISFWGIEKVFGEKGCTVEDVESIGKMWYKAPPFWDGLLEQYEGVDLSLSEKQIVIKIYDVNFKHSVTSKPDAAKAEELLYYFPKGKIMLESLTSFQPNFLKEIFPTCCEKIREHQVLRELNAMNNPNTLDPNKRKRDSEEIQQYNKKLKTFADEGVNYLPSDLFCHEDGGDLLYPGSDGGFDMDE
jgi:hypothetical protein